MAHRTSPQRGTSAIEFAFCSLILFPLLLGGLSVGFNLVRATQVAQFARDAGHLYAYGIDFTQASAQQLLVKLATGLNFALSGETGEVIFSTIVMVGPKQLPVGWTAGEHRLLSESEPGGVHALVPARQHVGVQQQVRRADDSRLHYGDHQLHQLSARYERPGQRHLESDDAVCQSVHLSDRGLLLLERL